MVWTQSNDSLFYKTHNLSANSILLDGSVGTSYTVLNTTTKIGVPDLSLLGQIPSLDSIPYDHDYGDNVLNNGCPIMVYNRAGHLYKKKMSKGEFKLLAGLYQASQSGFYVINLSPYVNFNQATFFLPNVWTEISMAETGSLNRFHYDLAVDPLYTSKSKLILEVDGLHHFLPSDAAPSARVLWQDNNDVDVLKNNLITTNIIQKPYGDLPAFLSKHHERVMSSNTSINKGGRTFSKLVYLRVLNDFKSLNHTVSPNTGVLPKVLEYLTSHSSAKDDMMDLHRFLQGYISQNPYPFQYQLSADAWHREGPYPANDLYFSKNDIVDRSPFRSDIMYHNY